MQTLETKHLTCRVNSYGAELQSLLVNARSDELIWQGDPDVWSGRAPILFPIVGALKHPESRHPKGPVALSKHGFARKLPFQVIDEGKTFARYSLQSNEATLSQYPWQFELIVHFELLADRLAIRYQVHNRDNCDMLFNLGSHPAFRLPLHDSTLSDYSIGFERTEQLSVYSVNEHGLLGPLPTAYPIADGRIELSEHIFDHDALVFKDIQSTRISLSHRRTGTRLCVATGGAPHLGLWAKPGAQFVCIEPWWGHADFSDANVQFAEKPSIQTLAANQSFSTEIEILPALAT